MLKNNKDNRCELPATFNIHPLTRCNMRCGYCHSHFAAAAPSRLNSGELRVLESRRGARRVLGMVKNNKDNQCGLPATINIHPLTRCNIRCGYCHSHFAAAAASAATPVAPPREASAAAAAAPTAMAAAKRRGEAELPWTSECSESRRGMRRVIGMVIPSHQDNRCGLPATINIHPLTRCNMRCGYCHSHFAAANARELPWTDCENILRKIAALPPLADGTRRRVTFAGGEPLLYPHLLDALRLAKELGLVTSIVSNGSLLNRSLPNVPTIAELAPLLDWFAISVDALAPETNRQIGRCTKTGRVLTPEEYLARADALHAANIKLKINTVVSRPNLRENFADFILRARPLRWKIFQVSEMEKENDGNFEKWKISEAEFSAFVERHRPLLKDSPIVSVPESQKDIRGTYAIVAPDGTFLDNASGTSRHTRPIMEAGIEAAFSEVNFSEERFRGRDGDYDFTSGKNKSHQHHLQNQPTTNTTTTANTQHAMQHIAQDNTQHTMQNASTHTASKTATLVAQARIAPTKTARFANRGKLKVALAVFAALPFALLGCSNKEAKLTAPVPQAVQSSSANADAAPKPAPANTTDIAENETANETENEKQRFAEWHEKMVSRFGEDLKSEELSKRENALIGVIADAGEFLPTLRNPKIMGEVRILLVDCESGLKELKTEKERRYVAAWRDDLVARFGEAFRSEDDPCKFEAVLSGIISACGEILPTLRNPEIIADIRKLRSDSEIELKQIRLDIDKWKREYADSKTNKQLAYINEVAQKDFTMAKDFKAEGVNEWFLGYNDREYQARGLPHLDRIIRTGKVDFKLREEAREFREILLKSLVGPWFTYDQGKKSRSSLPDYCDLPEYPKSEPAEEHKYVCEKFATERRAAMRYYARRRNIENWLFPLQTTERPSPQSQK